MNAPEQLEVGPGETSGRTVVKIGGALAALVILGTLAGAAFVPPMIAKRQAAQRLQCANGLRQLGLAALQYATDRQAFPHVRGADALDGGAQTPDGPRAWKRLVSAGYCDDPAELLCVAPTRRRTRSLEALAAQEAWLTDGQPDGPDDPTLREFEDLAYGWTRRALDADAPATALLAADKATLPRGGKDEPSIPGNHVGGWNVLRADATVEWLSVDADPFPGGYLTAIEDPERDGFLGLRPQTDPTLVQRQ